MLEQADGVGRTRVSGSNIWLPQRCVSNQAAAAWSA
jgi:hypothetical protein